MLTFNRRHLLQAAGGGFGAFNPAYLIKSPQSLLFSLAGDLVAPLINSTVLKVDPPQASSNHKNIQTENKNNAKPAPFFR